MHSKVVPLECARSALKFLGIVVYRKNFASCVSNFFGGVSYRNFFSYRTRIVKKITLYIYTYIHINEIIKEGPKSGNF